MTDPTAVKVAVRVRPLLPFEAQKGFKSVVEVIQENQQIIANDKGFTFNYVFGQDSAQDELYDKCVAPLMKNIFDGLNVTIFAYGQTGSGKTHSMGTAYNGEDNVGVIPRAIEEIFKLIHDNFAVDFTVSVSFMELYREVLYDLLANKPKDQCVLELREDLAKGVHIPNLTEIGVDTAEEVLTILMKGSLGRATASTNMNAQSSRSHSIFTIKVDMQQRTDESQSKTAKLHLVDLAGSERPKKTGAQGTIMKEGIDINKGLFVLGNVISCLGDEKNQNAFVPYRDSNLTRLLKDSLGGNSVTLMIACVSPADYNLDETLSTLRYADRAKRIKNKPIVNQDPRTAEINKLKRHIKDLQLQIVGQGGPIVSAAETDKLKTEISSLRLKSKEMMMQLSAAVLDKSGLYQKLLILQNANEDLHNKVSELKNQLEITYNKLIEAMGSSDVDDLNVNLAKLAEIKQQMDVLQTDQIKTDDEIRTHEETFTVLIKSTRSSAGSSKEFQEKNENHATRQISLNNKLEEVSRELILKQQLARQLVANTMIIVDEQAMLDTEKKIDVLEREKDELLQQLKNVKSQEKSNKIAEQRRKRVQELEEQLKDLKKKVTEQSRLIKMREKDEQKIKKLDSEITNMKTMKVKLLKQIREEHDRFRQQKQESEREIAKMRLQDRKKQTEMAKMKLTHEKQKNVLRRKFEEAAALNKRLQNTLMKRKQAHETRFAGKTEKITSWLKEELEIYVNLMEAESTLGVLLEDRATLQEQLDEMRQNPELCQADELKAIEEDIELRSVQIQDLQQKLLDSDEEAKAKVRFDSVQTMVEAKHALKTLFDQAADYFKGKVQLEREMRELQELHKELSEKNDVLMKEKKKMEEDFAEQLVEEEKKTQEKVGILLRQMRGIDTVGEEDNKWKDRYKIADEALKDKEQTIEEQEKTIAHLRDRLREIEQASLSAMTPPKKFKKPAAKKDKENEEPEVVKYAESPMLFDETMDNDDPFNDPDWSNTPLGKKIIDEKNKIRKMFKNTTFAEGPSEAGASKRSSGGGCVCKTKCNTVRCGCKKMGRGCGESCKCSEEMCLNRLSEVSSSDDKRDSASYSNTSSADEEFKRAKLEDETDISTRRRPKKGPLFRFNE